MGKNDEKQIELTKREKAITLSMLKYGYSIEKGTFVGDGLIGSDKQAIIDSVDRMVFEIEYLVNSGELEDLLLEAEKTIDRVDEISNLS